jgi:enamine deaminase RidA (YjgF/YER057c/UK114 family)
MAAQVGTALKRIVKLLAEAGAKPEHIVRLTWYLTSRRYLKLCRRYKYLLKSLKLPMATLMATPCKFRQVSAG